MGSLFAAIYCQSEPCESHLVVFYNSLAFLWGPEITGPRVFNTIRCASDTHVSETVAYRNLRIEKHQLKHTIHRPCCETQCFMLSKYRYGGYGTCPVTCQRIGVETLVFAMVSVASDVMFM